MGQEQSTSFRDAIWSCRDGRKIAVRDMTDDHLFNTFMYVSRRAKLLEAETEASYSGAAGLQGEMATYYATQACNDAELAERRCRVWIQVFKWEMTHRANRPDPWGD